MNAGPFQTLFVNAKIVLPDSIVERGAVAISDGLIAEVFAESPNGDDLERIRSEKVIDLQGNYLTPGFVDLHVHGGGGSDFMDGTIDAFRCVCACHLRHGTTAMTPTSTVAHWDDYLRFLELCSQTYDRRLCQSTSTSTSDPTHARIIGGHLYGPYFHRPAKGCHPDADFPPTESSSIRTAVGLFGKRSLFADGCS